MTNADAPYPPFCRFAPSFVVARQMLLQQCMEELLAGPLSLRTAPPFLRFLHPTRGPVESPSGHTSPWRASLGENLCARARDLDHEDEMYPPPPHTPSPPTHFSPPPRHYMLVDMHTTSTPHIAPRRLYFAMLYTSEML